ncbi:MAG: hypothetical protein ACR2OM_06310, partial [Aestuariivirgaceae bacterium]
TRYRTAYCRRCIQAGARGYSLTAFAGMLGVSRATLDHWAGRHPRFAAAIGAHKAKRAKFWEDQLARIARDGGKTGSTTMVMFALKSVASDDYPCAPAPTSEADHHPTEHVLSDDSAEKLKQILE